MNISPIYLLVTGLKNHNLILIEKNIYLLKEPCRLRPVPICDVTGKGAGVASVASAEGISGLEEVRLP